ncbi:hypothetical protein cje102_06954 [Campylobacter jejuni subsp. jejuni LMG 23218]|nr:hypothetical protein cje102_06954 [Campylobacter jejuni subsp. jejuni LMG 23218]
MQRQSPEQILKKLEVKAKEEEKKQTCKIKNFLRLCCRFWKNLCYVK